MELDEKTITVSSVLAAILYWFNIYIMRTRLKSNCFQNGPPGILIAGEREYLCASYVYREIIYVMYRKSCKDNCYINI